MMLYSIRRGVYSAPHTGSVAERLKAPVLKTGDPKGFQSSNLCASAIFMAKSITYKNVFGLSCIKYCIKSS